MELFDSVPPDAGHGHTPFIGGKWGVSSKAGTPAGTVTWSFAQGDLGGRYYLERFHLAAAVPEPMRATITAAFDHFADLANVGFAQVEDGPEVNIRIGMCALDGPFGTTGDTAYRYVDGVMREATICLDRAETWHLPVSPAPKGTVSLYGMALHEIGHALGIAHSDDPSSIMYYRLVDHGTWSMNGDDIAAMTLLYGARSDAPPVYAEANPAGASGSGGFGGGPPASPANPSTAGASGSGGFGGGAGITLHSDDPSTAHALSELATLSATRTQAEALVAVPPSMTPDPGQ